MAGVSRAGDNHITRSCRVILIAIAAAAGRPSARRIGRIGATMARVTVVVELEAQSLQPREQLHWPVVTVIVARLLEGSRLGVQARRVVRFLWHPNLQ